MKKKVEKKKSKGKDIHIFQTLKSAYLLKTEYTWKRYDKRGSPHLTIKMTFK